MVNRQSRKEQIAKQLGVSVKVLEQYWHLKQAESSGQVRPASKLERLQREWRQSR